VLVSGGHLAPWRWNPNGDGQSCMLPSELCSRLRESSVATRSHVDMHDGGLDGPHGRADSRMRLYLGAKGRAPRDAVVYARK
jgi:hypothetical protein